MLGAFGIIGFVAEFGLLAIAIFRVRWVLGKTKDVRESLCLSAVSLMVALAMIDSIPNSPTVTLTFLLAGSLVGRAENIVATSRFRRGESRGLTAGGGVHMGASREALVRSAGARDARLSDHLCG